VALAAQITAQEAWVERDDGPQVVVPDFVRELIEEISVAARESELVDQSSGVSARVAIAAIELLVSNLERRALAIGDSPVWPRVCDLPPLAPAITGKLEMVYEGEQQGPELVVRKLVGNACAKLAGRKLPEIGREAGSGSDDDSGPWAPILAWFAAGNELSVSDETPFEQHELELARVPGLAGLVAELGATRGERAFWAELALEALHQAVKVARQDLDSRVSYKELLRFQLLKPPVHRGPRRSGDAN